MKLLVIKKPHIVILCTNIYAVNVAVTHLYISMICISYE